MRGDLVSCHLFFEVTLKKKWFCIAGCIAHAFCGRMDRCTHTYFLFNSYDALGLDLFVGYDCFFTSRRLVKEEQDLTLADAGALVTSFNSVQGDELHWIDERSSR